MTTLAHRSSVAGTASRRPSRAPSTDPLGVAHVPPRVAPADPRDRSAHRRGRGRGHQRHGRLQLGAPGLRGVRLGQCPASSSTPPIRASWRQSLAAAEERFGTTDVIGHRSLPVPGSVETVEFRAQDPRGPYARLALRRGSYPEGPSQVAVTDGVATLLGLEIGKTLALDGRRRTVVGIVENPRELSDEFALVSPSSAGAPDTVTVLVDADDEAFAAFREAQGDRSALVGFQLRGNYEPAPELAMFSVATVFMLLASLIATAGFAVIAQRRLRQLGMLAAIGATEKHLRLVLLWNGAIVGAVGALIGTLAGLALWLAVAPMLEPALDYRLDRSSLPWALLAMTALVAVLAATAAAWWPGRAVARVPVTRALSARPPEAEARTPLGNRRRGVDRGGNRAASCSPAEAPRRSSSPGSWRRSSARCSWARWRFASSPAPPGTPRSPCAWRYETSPATRPAPGRHSPPSPSPSASPRRSSSSRRPRRRSQPPEPPNLSSRQIRVYTGAVKDGAIPIQTPAELDRMAARVRQLAADLDDAAVIPLRSAFQPGEPSRAFEGVRVRFSIALSRQVDTQASRPSKGSSTSPRLPCSGTSESTPRRSIRARTSWPTRACRPTSSSFPSSGRRGGTNTMCCRSRTSRESTAGSTSAGTPTVSCRPRSSRSTVFAATAGDRSRPAGSSSRAGL